MAAGFLVSDCRPDGRRGHAGVPASPGSSGRCLARCGKSPMGGIGNRRCRDWSVARKAKSTDAGAREQRPRGRKHRRRCPGAPRSERRIPMAVLRSPGGGAERLGVDAPEPGCRRRKSRHRCPGAPSPQRKSPAPAPAGPQVGAERSGIGAPDLDGPRQGPGVCSGPCGSLTPRIREDSILPAGAGGWKPPGVVAGNRGPGARNGWSSRARRQ